VDDTTVTTLSASGVGAGGAWSAAREKMLGIENRAPVIDFRQPVHPGSSLEAE
jgi:hypothetical protein